MKDFLLEVYWPDMTPALVADLVVRIRRATRNGPEQVRYVGCTMTPSDETCFVRLSATRMSVVRDLVAGLELHGARVSEIVDVLPTARST